MTESSAPLRATLKAGTGYEVPWVTVEASNPNDLEQKLRGIIDSRVLETVAEAASLFQATQNAVPLTQPQAPAQQAAPAQPEWSQPQVVAGVQQQSQGWGAAQQQAPQSNGIQLHPEGKPCNCGAVLQYKVVNRKSDGKQFKFWACPNQRNRDDGHDTEFAN